MEFEKIAETFKVLGDPTRLRIIALLQEREFCVCELVPLFQISQPAVSKHLSRLKAVEIVTETRKGQWVYYSLNQKRLEEIGYSLKRLPNLQHEIKKLEEKGLLVQCD